MKNKPYINLEENNNYIIRFFSKNINETQLEWHLDSEDRKIIPLNSNDWKFQFDNKLPKNLNESIRLSKEKLHRIIKGNSDLYLLIYKK